KLRRSNIDASAGAVEEVARIVAQIRARWPAVRVLLRADSGFAREGLMRWCELNGVDYLFGLARKPAPHCRDHRRAGCGAPTQRKNRPAGALLQRLYMVDLGQLEPRAAGCREGPMDRRPGQPAVCRQLAAAARGPRPPSL